MIENPFLRDMESYLYTVGFPPPDFLDFADAMVLPRIDLPFKQASKIKEKRWEATCCAHNLIYAGLVNRTVADSRDGKGKSRARVWDAIIKAGFADRCTGSEQSGKVTRYYPRAKLLRLRKQWKLDLLIDLQLERNTERPHDPTKQALVLLHSSKVDPVTGLKLDELDQKQPLSFHDWAKNEAGPRGMQSGLEYVQAMEDLIERINRSNLRHSWQAFHVNPMSSKETAFQPNSCVRQIHVGEMFRGTRLYSWSLLSGQSLPKEDRKRMLIDGEPVAEFDYSGMATRMLYHRTRLRGPKGDVYKPDELFPRFYAFEPSPETAEIVREFGKRATNICWNVSSRANANSAISKLITDHPDRDLIESVLKSEGMKRTDVVTRIQAAHPKLAEDFFSGVGIELMTVDGSIMLRILETFADADKPVLGIHDSIVVRESDRRFARRTMKDAYRRFMLFEPVIKRVY